MLSSMREVSRNEVYVEKGKWPNCQGEHILQKLEAITVYLVLIVQPDRSNIWNLLF